MIWDSRTVLVNWGYRPITEPAIKWARVYNGNWVGSDRGAGEDVYKTRVMFSGPRTELLDIEDVLNDNRFEYTITCGQGEEIFGADVDHSGSLTVTVTDYGESKRTGFDEYSIPLELRLISPSFVSTSPSLATLRQADFSSTQHAEFDVDRKFTYDGSRFHSDREKDPGIFETEFTQTTDEMKAIRRYLSVTARANTVSFPSLANVTTPFGSRLGTGPFNCKIVDWKDTGRANYLDWGIRIRFALER